MKKIWVLSFVLVLCSCGDSEQGAVEQDSSEQSVSQEVMESGVASVEADALNTMELTPFKVLSISEGVYDDTSALQINFNLPVKKGQQLDQLIRVKQHGNLIKTDWIFSEEGLALYYPFIDAETSYEISVSQSLSSAGGKILSQAALQQLTTQPKQKSARFVSRGNTLLKSDKHLPIEAVNVDAVELKFWRINDQHLSQFLQYPNKRDIYSLQRMPEVAELVYTSHFALTAVKNKTEQHNLPIGGIKEIKNSGVYFVTMMPDDWYDYDFESTWFIQTDLGLHVRFYPRSVAVFTHHLPAADSFAEVKVSVIDNKGQVISEGITDTQGFIELDVENQHNMQFVMAQKEGALNLVRFNQPKLDLSEFNLASRAFHQQELFLYAPRDLFRPGETVNINGLLRDADGQLVAASPIKVRISRPDNKLFKEMSWMGDEQSFYSSEFTLPEDAMTGSWKFTAKLANNNQFHYDFSVEDFLPERLKLDLSVGNKSKHVQLQDTLKIDIQSEYLYGAPAAGNRFDATVSVAATTDLFDDFDDYVFGSNHYRDYDSNFTTDAAELNEQGFAQLELPNKWQNTQFPLRVNSHVNVYESGGRPIARSIQQVIWPNEVAIGVKPQWQDRFASPNQANYVSLVAVNRAGKAQNLDRAEILLIQENRERYWHWGDDGWDYRNNNKEVPVYNAILNLSATADNTVRLPLSYGSYRLEVRNQQQQIISSYRFFSGWRWYDPYTSNGEKPDQVKLAWQADAVVAGEQADLQITAPYQGTAVITVESDELLWHQQIKLTSAQQTVAIPIDSNWRRHDLYASVVVIKAGEQLQGRSHLPQRALGVIHLPLKRADRKLSLTIDHPDKTLPDEPLTITLKASQMMANQTTYVTLAAVDTGVLNVSNFKTPEPFEWFFAQREFLPAIRDVYGTLIAMIDAQQAQQKFGGDADISRGGDEAKADVQIVSLITDKVAFNQAGEAEITLPIPYFNGELRLMALAFNDLQFVGIDSHIKVAAPVVISTSLPRFMAKGDVSSATIEVHNTEDSSIELNVTVTADKQLGGEVLVKKWTLAADSKQVIQLPISAQAYQGLAEIRVQAESKQGFQMNRSWKLGLRPAMPAVIDQHKAVLKPQQAFTIDKDTFNQFDAMNLKAVVNLSDTPILNRAEHIQQLLQYPYGCLEQTSSKAWPLLFAEAEDFSLYANQDVQLFEQRNKIINQAISRLLGMQIYSGGFGLWSDDSPEEYWLTVYVTDFLIQARKLGYQVPDDALNKAITRLQAYVRNAGRINSDLAQYISHRNHFEIAYKAYAAYVLAEMKQISLQDIRRLYDEFSDQARSPLPLAHLAFGLELMGDERRANEAWLKTIDFKWDRNRYDYYGDYGSKIRDFAEVIALGASSQMMQNMPQSTLHLMTPLQADMSNRRWLSTQERSTIFKTAKKLKQASPADEQWQLDITRGDQQQSYQQSEDLAVVWREQDALVKTTLKNTGNKPVFVEVKYQGYLQQHQAENNGIVVRKKYFDINGNQVNLRTIKSGDFVLVHLEMSLDEKYRYLPDAMVIDLLPAGLELENQNLEHALKLDDIKVDGKYVRDWGGNTDIKHSEFRDDRFVAALTLSSYHNAHVFYLARAVTPGDYVIPPALVEDMYRPEIRATSDDLGHLIIR